MSRAWLREPSRMLRGSSWVNAVQSAHPAYRFSYAPWFRDDDTGLRLVRRKP
jgi:formylglycine-generating enzyme required for sulfatase activity